MDRYTNKWTDILTNGQIEQIDLFFRKVKKEVQEIKLEDMTETIGGTVLSERRNDMVQGQYI